MAGTARKGILILCGWVAFSTTSAAFALSVYSTDPAHPDHYLNPSTPVPVEEIPARSAILKYDKKNLHQTIEGFGAALTDSSVIAINKLSPFVRMNLLHKLFDRKDGLNVNFLRVPIGASDFSVENYSYLDLPTGETDPELKLFDAARAGATIEMLKEIRDINPDIKILLSPWSPPGWMKTSGSMINGSLKPEFFESHARYLVKSIQAFEEAGIPISYVTIQNEPFYGNDQYASMYMSVADQIASIKILGNDLRRSGLATKILALDHNWDLRPDAESIYAGAKEWLGGIAYHCYGGHITDLQGSTAPLFQTECTAIEDGTSFKDTLQSWVGAQVVDGGLVGAKLALGWNLVLDENHGPTIGNCPNCSGMVDVNLKEQTFQVNPEMIAIAHAGKFVLPGAKRMETVDYKSTRFSYIAYLNPGGDVVLVIQNKIDKPIALAVPDQDNHYYKVRVPAGGVTTVAIASPEMD